MSYYDARRDPVRIAGRVLRWAVPWVIVPSLVGVFVSGKVDVRSLPLVGSERETAVLFLDGQAYFGHLDDSGESGTLVLRDVYYFQDAKNGPTGLPVGLVRRGQEVHEPADGMRINRDQILAVEQVGPHSAVAAAIEVERQLTHAAVPAVSLNKPALGTTTMLIAQRVATEHVLQRAHTAAVAQLSQLNELVLPISKAQAQVITEKTLADFRTVRRNALTAIAKVLGMNPSETDTYVRTTDAQLENQSFTNEPGVLLAPDLFGIVTQASTLYTQVGDAASKQLTQPTAKPSSSPLPSSTPSPSASPSARP